MEDCGDEYSYHILRGKEDKGASITVLIPYSNRVEDDGDEYSYHILRGWKTMVTSINTIFLGGGRQWGRVFTPYSKRWKTMVTSIHTIF